VRRRLLGLALTSVAALCAFDVVPIALVQTLDQSIYDTRLRLASSSPDDRVVIVDIDEASIARMGRWPWDRSRMGELASSLVERGGAAVVGIDIVFAEPQREADEDAALAQRLRGHPVVLGYYFTSDRGGRTSGALPAPVLSSQALPGLGIGITAWDGFGANLVSLQEAAAGGGFFNPLIDGDGTVRALPLLAEFRGGLYESFAVAVLRQWLGSASLQLSADALSLRGARIAEHALSDALTALVPFAGRVGQSRTRAALRLRPAADVLEGRADWSRFKDRIVLIGTSAPGLTDLRATPLRAAFPGVEIHATMISAALASVEQAKAGGALLKSRSEVSAALGALAAGVIGGLLALGLPALGALGAVTLSLVAAITLWGSATIAWNNLGLAMPVSAALALVVALLLLNLTVGYFAGRKRRAVAALFGEYVSPALVERMVRDPARFALVGSENRELTILFVDIRDLPGSPKRCPRKAARIHQCLFDRHDRKWCTAMAVRRQVHRRCGDGLLGRAAGRRAACGSCGRRGTVDARGSPAPESRLRREGPAADAGGNRYQHWRSAGRRHGLAIAPHVHGDRRCGQPRVTVRGTHQALRRRDHRRRNDG
jgi:adenylate cyclase